MSHSSIDRSFLLVTLAFEKELFNTDGLVNVLLELIKTRDLHLALASHAPMTEVNRRELDEETDNFIQNFNGSVDQCFDAIEKDLRDQIRSSISPFLAGGLDRYIELLDAVVAAEQKRQKQKEKRVNPDDHDDDDSKKGRSEKISALIEKPVLKAGRFYALKEINKDGMGLIYKGLDDRIIRYVAIKTTGKVNTTAEQDKYNKCLIREGKIHGRLEHPNILPVFDAGLMESGKPYIVMHLINKTWSTLGEAIARFHAGKPLIKSAESQNVEPVQANATPEQPLAPLNFEKLSDKARSDFRDLLGRFVEVCEAVNHVHSKGFLHRDLKPTNIMVGNHAETFLMDFGLACMLKNAKTQNPELADDPDLTHEGITEDDFYTAGTPEYKAPEQHDKKYGTLDERTDTYALGLILCEIVTGQRPFEDRANTDKKSDSNDLKAILRMEAMRKGLGNLRAGNRTIPRPLQAICQKAVAFEQKDRYQTALELGKDVKNWLDNEAVTSYASQELRREKIVRWARKRPAKAATLIAAVLTAAISIGLYSRINALSLANKNYALKAENASLQLDSKNAEITFQLKEIRLQKIAKLEETRKMTLNNGSWEGAIRVIEELDVLLNDFDMVSNRSALIDLRLDKMKALDGYRAGIGAATEVKEMLADYQAHPADYSKAQIGRLLVYKGDLSLEILKPNEISPYAQALQYLEPQDPLYDYARGMTEPNPEKAVAYMDAAASLNPYAMRPLVVSSVTKFLMGRWQETLATLKARQAIMPEDNNILLGVLMIEQICMNRNPSTDNSNRAQKYFKELGLEEGFSIIFELLPKFIQGDPDPGLNTRLYQNLISLVNKVQNKNNLENIPLVNGMFANPPAAVNEFNQFIPALIGYNQNNPGISQILMLSKFFKINLPEPLSMDKSIDVFKIYLSKFPIQEIARVALLGLIDNNRFDEAAELLAHFPERSIAISSKDIFYSILAITSNYYSKIVIERRNSIDTAFTNQTFLNHKQLAERIKLVIPKLALKVPTLVSEPVYMLLLVDNCEFLNDPDLALAILKSLSPFDSPDNKTLAYIKTMLQAKKNPEKAIEFLEWPNSTKGDLWAALWIKIHRDYPELAQKHPKLQEMPENPFMPTSIEYPLPLTSEMNEYFGSFTGKVKPTTPLMMPN